MKVKEVMTEGLATVQPHDTIQTMEERMADLNVHALPVVDEEGRAVGIITSSDFEPDLPRTTAAADLIGDQVYQIESEADAREAARRMLDMGVHHLVVTEGGQAIGMLSSFDLLRVIAAG